MCMQLLSDTGVSASTGAHVTSLMPFDHVIQVTAMAAHLTTGVESMYRAVTTGSDIIQLPWLQETM